MRHLAVTAAVLMIAAVTAGGLARLRIETTAESFLPSGDPSVAAIERHARTFGGDPVVVVLESKKPRSLLLGDGQLAALMALEGRLARLPDVAVTYGPGTVMNQIAISSQNLLARISGTRDGLRARAEAQARARHRSAREQREAGDKATAAFDRRYGALLVKGLPAGLPTTKNPGFVKNVIYDASGHPRTRWHFIVPGENSVALLVRPRQDLDQASARRLVSAIRQEVGRSGLDTSRVTVSGVPAVTAALAAGAEREVPIIGGLAVLAILLRFLVAPAGTGWLRRLWPLGAALAGGALTLAAFGWTGTPMSLGAVMLLPLLVGVGSSFTLYLVTRGDRRRVLAVAAASAAAFAALAVSPLPFVRELGLALALGVTMTLPVAWAFGRLAGTESAPPDKASPRFTMPSGKHRVILAGLLVVAGLGWAALPRLAVAADPEEMARGLPELASARYVERVLGSSGEVGIVLEGPDVKSPEALRWLRAAENAAVARYGDRLRPVLTAADLLGFLGDSPTPEQVAAGVELLPPYLTGAVFSPDGRQAVMTFGLSLQDLRAQAALLDGVRAAMPAPPPGYRVEQVGLPVAAAHAYERISTDRYLANAAGIAAASLALLIVLRRRSDVPLAATAALLATGWMLGALWVAGVALNPLTTALGSLATVTACEFTVMRVDAERRRSARLRRMAAWACATSALGYLALVPSRIALLREFGITLACAVLLSYLAAVAVVALTTRHVPPDRRRRACEVPAPAHVEVAS